MTILEKKIAELEKYEHELQSMLRTRNHFSEYFQDQVSEIESKINECMRIIEEINEKQ